jgi:hypothetical protein
MHEAEQTALLPKPQSKRRRRWFLAALVMVFLAICITAFILYNRASSADEHLRQALERADRLDPNWRLEDLENRRERIPDEENAGLRILAARQTLATYQVPSTYKFPTKIYEDFENLAPTQRPTNVQLAGLIEESKQAATAMARAREVADLPNGRYPITYSPDAFTTLLPHGIALGWVRDYLWFDALCRVEEGDTEGAVRSCQAILNTGRSIGDEFFIMQMLRMSTGVQAVITLERALARGQAFEPSLARFQQLVEKEGAFPSLLTMTRGERAIMDGFFGALESGAARQSQIFGSQVAYPRFWPPAADDVFGVLNSPGVKEAHASYVEFWTDMVEAAKLPIEETGTEFDEERWKALPSWASPYSPLDKLLRYDVGKPVKLYRRSRAALRSAAAALAAERYRMANGKWPVSLQDLMPTFLAKVPLDPYDGKPLRYRRLQDGCVIYSIGPDGRDDGGDLARKKGPPPPGTDIGFRLWDADRR